MCARYFNVGAPCARARVRERQREKEKERKRGERTERFNVTRTGIYSRATFERGGSNRERRDLGIEEGSWKKKRKEAGKKTAREIIKTTFASIRLSLNVVTFKITDMTGSCLYDMCGIRFICAYIRAHVHVCVCTL